MDEIAFENLSQEQADNYGLVLSAYGLSHSIKQSRTGWEIWVDETVRDRALNLILKYIEENPDLSIPDAKETQTYIKTYTAIWGCSVLLLCHIAVSRYYNFEKILNKYGASAYDILHGDIYRTVTSLMLHSDYLHLTGNVAGLAIFGTAVCSITGSGMGWLMILLSGVLGNLINAALFQYGHISIGASTAVFGAVGILAAYQLCRKIKIAEQRMKAWLPIAGGLALLGILGSGRHSDLTAHLFGFMVGIGLGILYEMILIRFLKNKHQIYCMIATIATIVLSWLWGMVI
jgi:rhomboid protease GluP